MSAFLDIAADWADQHAVDIKFARDLAEGWFAIVSMADGKGPFSAMINEIPRKDKEPIEEYEGRIYSLLIRETARARANRIMKLNKITSVRAA